MKLHGARKRLVELMQQGRTLMWGPGGPVLVGTPRWPRRRTVEALIRDGVLKWAEASDRTQANGGMWPVVLTDEWKGGE